MEICTAFSKDVCNYRCCGYCCFYGQCCGPCFLGGNLRRRIALRYKLKHDNAYICHLCCATYCEFGNVFTLKFLLATRKRSNCNRELLDL